MILILILMILYLLASKVMTPPPPLFFYVEWFSVLKHETKNLLYFTYFYWFLLHFYLNVFRKSFLWEIGREFLAYPKLLSSISIIWWPENKTWKGKKNSVLKANKNMKWKYEAHAMIVQSNGYAHIINAYRCPTYWASLLNGFMISLSVWLL